jgi:hypothetical protein
MFLFKLSFGFERVNDSFSFPASRAQQEDDGGAIK